jgi:hypothetical protein
MTMFHGHARLARVALLVMGVSVAVVTFAASTASASAAVFDYEASAYGTQAIVANGVVTSGPSALAGISCTSTIGAHSANTLATVNVPNVLNVGTINTTAASKLVPGGSASTASATTAGINVLNGLITVTAIKSESTTSHNNSTGTFSTSGAGSQLVGLSINGHAITATPAPNTTITLPGIGYVVLNEQISHIGATSASLTVNAIHVVVTGPDASVPLGTQVIVADAKSSLSGPELGLLQGGAFGTGASALNGTILLGPSFPAGLPCLGTGGLTLHNAGAAVNLGKVLTTGTIDDTAEGIVSATQLSAETTSTIQHLNLLNGVVTATAVKADVTTNGNPPTLGDKSSFLGLKVLGLPIAVNPHPNTKITLAGLGTLWLHRQIKTSKGINVIMVQLVIGNAGNLAHLPVGTVVDVADAAVGVR